MERVQKIIARAGLASRRAAEQMIRDGEVTINGKIATLGSQADLSQDAIKVRGKLLRKTAREKPVYLAFHKPRGVICMVADDPEGRPTLSVFVDRLGTRVFPIGRMEFNGEGLVLLTNDGELLEKVIKHPTIPRVYEIKVKGHPDQAKLDKLARGTKIDGRILQPYSVRMTERRESKSILELTFVGMGVLDLKTLLARREFLVERIKLKSIGQIKLGSLAPGEHRELKASQVEAMLTHPELGLRGIEEGAHVLPDRDKFTEPKTSPEPPLPESPGKRRPGTLSAEGGRTRAPRGESRRESKPRSPGRGTDRSRDRTFPRPRR